jgi:hypothetical protein
MQEQMTAAILNAAGAGNAGGPGAAAQPRPAGGQRLLVAMIQARESGCKCGACALLRQEVETMMTAMLKGIADVGSADTEPLPSATA